MRSGLRRGLGKSRFARCLHFGKILAGMIAGAGKRAGRHLQEALGAGEVDGAVLFDPYLDMARELDGVKHVIPHEFALTRTIEAFATDQESDALHEALNEWVIEKDLAGYWDELEEKWFSDQYAVASAPPPYACPAATPVQ